MKKKLTPISKYSCQLVRDASTECYFSETMPIHSSDDVVATVKKLTNIHTAPTEQFWVLFLNLRGNVIGYSMVAQGDMYSSFVDSRAIFRAAILTNAHKIIVAHNHPSGDAYPSEEDIRLTRRLVKAGRTIGINILDHIIIGMDEEACSLCHEGLVDF